MLGLGTALLDLVRAACLCGRDATASVEEVHTPLCSSAPAPPPQKIRRARNSLPNSLVSSGSAPLPPPAPRMRCKTPPFARSAPPLPPNAPLLPIKMPLVPTPCTPQLVPSLDETGLRSTRLLWARKATGCSKLPASMADLAPRRAVRRRVLLGVDLQQRRSGRTSPDSTSSRETTLASNPVSPDSESDASSVQDTEEITPPQPRTNPEDLRGAAGKAGAARAVDVIEKSRSNAAGNSGIGLKPKSLASRMQAVAPPRACWGIS